MNDKQVEKITVLIRSVNLNKSKKMTLKHTQKIFQGHYKNDLFITACSQDLYLELKSLAYCFDLTPTYSQLKH